MSDETAPKNKLLLVDDDMPFLEDAVAVLSRDFDCVAVADPDNVLKACDVEDPDVILLDLDFGGEPLGFELLPAIKDANPYLPVVMWTETDDVLARLQAQELGAFYYVHKATRPGDLRVVIDAALRKNRALDRQPRDARRTRQGVGQSRLRQRRDASRWWTWPRARPRRTTPFSSRASTGVGKGVVAYEIHKRSSRANQEFMVVECAGITEQLADNELFGHERGAFTGAYRREPGVCEAAHHGTLFLDEVGDMPASIQAKIRRVVEDSRVRRVGGQKEKLVDIRVIAATNRNLEEDVETERFRTRPLLPAEPHAHSHPAALREEGGHPAAGRALPRRVHRVDARALRAVARCRDVSREPRLGRQRARTQERRRAGVHHVGWSRSLRPRTSPRSAVRPPPSSAGRVRRPRSWRRPSGRQCSRR